MDDPEALAGECLHKYSRSPEGALVCSKCGSSLTSSGAPLPKSSNFCLRCGAKVEQEIIICTACGAPLDKAIKRKAMLSGADPRRCSHDYRYIEDGKICLKCAKTVPLKTPIERRKYAAALGKSICVYCGQDQVQGRDICPRCARRYEAITPLQPDRAIYNPKEAAAHAKSSRQAAAAAARAARPVRGPAPQRPGPYGRNPVTVLPPPNVPIAGGVVHSVSEQTGPAVCASCRATLPEDATFCEACGTPVAVTAPSGPGVGPIVCSSCGSTAPPDSTFCEACGSPVTVTVPLGPGVRHIQARQTVKRQSKTRNMGIAGMILLIAGVFLLLIGIVLASKKDDAGIEIPGTTETKRVEVTNNYTGERSYVDVEQQGPSTPVSFKSIGYVMVFFGIVALAVGFVLLMQSKKQTALQGPGMPPARARPPQPPTPPPTPAEQTRPPPEAASPISRPVIEVAEVSVERDRE